MPTEEEKMLAGELYAAFDPALLAARTRAKRLLHRLNVTEYVLGEAARATLAELLPHAGENLWVEPPFHCDYGTNITCGDNVYFNVNCVVLDAAPVRIGSNVLFGPGVQLYTATHPLDASTRRT
ncbi:MAG: sugar O-acetyltransferase, partial [Hymenobacter sp.]